MTKELDHIIEQHLQKIYRTCLGFSGDHALAKDLVQESCVNICLGFENFRNQSSISTWIYRVTVNTCLMHKRKQENKMELSSLDPEFPDREKPIQEQNEPKLSLLKKLVAELPEKDRLIIIMYLNGLSQHETSEVIGISANYVGVRVKRIKHKLFNQFNDRWKT